MFFLHTGRIPEGAKSLGKRHSESTRNPLVTSSLTQRTCPVSSHTVLSTSESLPEAGCSSFRPAHHYPYLQHLLIPPFYVWPCDVIPIWLQPIARAVSSPGHTVNGGGSKDFLPKCIKAPAYRKDTGRALEGCQVPL